MKYHEIKASIISRELGIAPELPAAQVAPPTHVQRNKGFMDQGVTLKRHQTDTLQVHVSSCFLMFGRRMLHSYSLSTSYLYRPWSQGSGHILHLATNAARSRRLARQRHLRVPPLQRHPQLHQHGSQLL